MRQLSITRALGIQWAALAVKTNLDELYASILTAVKLNGPEYKKGGTVYYALKFLRFMESSNPEFTLFTKGNSKLPFLSWSTLPGVNCPGAGACLNWCYSFKAWRYPAAYFRQLQNTILERHNPELIRAELDRVLCLPSYSGRRVDLRLYVDGDFPNLDIMTYWFNTLEERPRIAAYGYSKSFPMFHQYAARFGHIPGNYALNGSKGGKYDHVLKSMKGYSFFRGAYEGFNLGRKITPMDMTSAEKREIRKLAGAGRAFICPGLCGSCTSMGHACGNLDTFKDMRIITPIH